MFKNLELIIKYFNYCLIVLVITLSSCNTTLHLTRTSRIEKQISNSSIFQNEFNGFVLYDIKKGKNIISINENKKFTPASNTKILTFYTSLKVLNDSIPLIKYQISGDSLIFWGTGNPICLNPDFTNNTNAIDFLKLTDKQLYYCTNNFQDNRFGSGWAWDDYLYSYQFEKSAFPIYGNRLFVNQTQESNIISPDIFNIIDSPDSNYYWRDEFKNEFTIGVFNKNKKLEIPFITDTITIVKLLNLATGKQINKCSDISKLKSDTKVLKIKTPDSLYIRLLHYSDNFIAEQLMQMCSFSLFDTLNTRKTIKYSKEFILPELKDNCRWVDGSGLSRYNLFSPNNLVYALKKIYKKLTWDQITKYFPTAGKSGTLKDYSKDINKPYIFAKSGSLSNNYNLSGYLQTKKGNRYIFSFMNNHFLNKSTNTKAEMEKVFKFIYNNY